MLVHKAKSKMSEFSLVDSSVLSLIVEKTRLKKEKYNLMLTKTIIVYILIVTVALFSYVYDIISKNIMVSALVFGTLLLFVVYLFTIQHYNNIDRDLDEVISLLQTKTMLKKKVK